MLVDDIKINQDKKSIRYILYDLLNLILISENFYGYLNSRGTKEIH